MDNVIQISGDIFVTVSIFKGRKRVDIRQFYTTPTGEQKPSPKGVNMSVEEFMMLKQLIGPIDEAINKL